ncbi:MULTISPECIES: restriction endonuclease subunit S [unclassified Exiguobacterium]|uniref:restriction endonuclease subunit S n=1 Tax=unclassified Exiguobacterium TaxID=2644629 RepID=UPI00103F23E1|nr:MULTISPECIES: restriction endonuclease subunit S [unclassified Exiguobacterium]TCI73594.1 restriction endonuclease subunit S [Exiguobacterium sp. IPCI3]TCI82751.1 restriction endonuclease subunit S [Exiguobacterium sp. IPCH1]TCI83805.1 restriction endonuclease subunit S [Exiguobacterium sp. IPBC4]
MKNYKMIDLVSQVINGEWGEEVVHNSPSVKVIRSTNFTNVGQLNLEKGVVSRSINQTKVLKKRLEFGDTIIEKSGGSPGQPVGRVVFFDINEDTFLCNNFTSILRPNTEIVDSKYFFYLLFNSYRQRKVMRFQNNTTGIINLKLEQYLRGSEVVIPSKIVQRKIVEILDAAFLLIQKRQSQIKVLDELAQSIFAGMFGSNITSKYQKFQIDKLAINSKNAIKAGPFGSSLKKEFYVLEGYKVYGQEQVIRDDLSYGNYYINEAKYKQLESCSIKENDILISLVGTFGKICIVPSVFEPGIINPRLMKISPDLNKIHPKFFKFLMSLPSTLSQITTQSHGGTMGIVNVGIMKNFKIIVPPIELQQKFVRELEMIDYQKKIMENSLCELEKLYISQLQKSFKEN